MSFLNLDLSEIEFKDAMQLDAYERLRVSNIFSQFDNFNQYGVNSRDWAALNVGTGTTVHNANESVVELRTNGTASGAKVVRQNRINWRTRFGRSALIHAAGTFGVAVNGVRRRVGYFDDNDGVFFEQTITDIRWVLRTSISGSPSDAKFATQANWNVDKLDGTGPSGITLDISNRQIWFIDIQWIGAGRIRVGFLIGGHYIICHQFLSGNTDSTTYLRTPHLPVRGEIENIATADSDAIIKFVGSAIMMEGGDNDFSRGYLNSASNGTGLVTVTTRRPLLTVRGKATFNSIPNRGWLVPLDFSIRTSSNDVYWEVIVAGTLNTPTWVSANADSLAEFDVSSTTISGGFKAISGYSVAGQGQTASQSLQDVIDNFPTGVDGLNGTQTIYSIVATAVTGSASVGAVINWRELY